MTRKGTYVEKSSYDEQLLLATRMMEEFIAKLKELGHYDKSLIIIQSDHGFLPRSPHQYDGQPLRDYITIDDATSDAIARVDARGKSGRQIDVRYSPLLMIKAPVECPNMGRTLKVDWRLAQLLDLKAYLQSTLADAINACEYPRVDYVDMHQGIGENATRINHYRITRAFKWSIMDDIPLRHD